MKTTNDIRTAFLEFFRRNGHEVLPSSPLVPHNDPTLMFANAGMNQFKNIFTGAEKPAHPRAATSQKVVRAGGKHNDLDNVGYTARHHTFFEMLGNFSFGDYFKERAIELAWEFLTKDMGIDPARLSFTVYHTDDEAYAIWKRVTGCDDARILRVPTKDNFWSMGDTGPCGPCSEIFYDHKTGEGEWALNADGSDRFGERFVEIWNLVFMQFEQKEGGEQVPLPKPSIDTGMGLERIAAVMQGVHDNYAIDLFQALITEIIRVSESIGASKGRANTDPAFKVIADHLRSSCFLIADGVLPSNEGRGYVLRRIMRRAMRYAHQLGCHEPLMYRLVPKLVELMGSAYPELKRAEPVIAENLRAEEERFQQTLGRGLKLLEEESASLKKGGQLNGEAAFKLYDTYGFPLDLTEDILRARGITVDNDGFEAAMARQKAMSSAAWSGSGGEATNTLWFALREQFGATQFLGYEQDEAEAQVLAIVKNGAQAEHAESGEEVSIILNRTPFYGESGGQVGDSGFLFPSPQPSPASGKGSISPPGEAIIAEVRDTIKPLEDFTVHHALLRAPLKKGAKLAAKIDTQRRARTRANHSATHLLHKALRDVLGPHVTQKGSLVAPDKLRFDFSHGKAMSAEEIANVEARVNRVIWRNTPVCTEVMHPDDAINKGAMALFGEKYGEKVRVLSMGSEEDAAPYSVELCGGTHVHATGDIGVFKILSESAVAAGVRRIEAVTRDDAFNYLTAQESMVKLLADNFKVASAELPERIGKLTNDNKRLEKELAEAKKKLALGGSGGAAVQKEMVGDVAFIGKAFEELNSKELRSVAETFLKDHGPGVAAVATSFEGKASIVVAVSKEITTRISAVPLVQAAVETLGGKGGGGRPEIAQGGGPEADKLEECLIKIKKML